MKTIIRSFFYEVIQNDESDRLLTWIRAQVSFFSIFTQIDRQLTAYMKRVEDVLGRGWENHVEGQKLKADGDSFRAKLNTQEIFDDWARKVQQRNLGVSGK